MSCCWRSIGKAMGLYEVSMEKSTRLLPMITSYTKIILSISVALKRINNFPMGAHNNVIHFTIVREWERDREMLSIYSTREELVKEECTHNKYKFPFRRISKHTYPQWSSTICVPALFLLVVFIRIMAK